jgi:basic amino acid/polyamine antiporter, APA family
MSFIPTTPKSTRDDAIPPLAVFSRHELPRKLGWLDATLIIIGIVIGSGIFLLPNLIAQNLPSRGAIISVWIISGLLSYIGALAYAELGAMMPATGGHYVYLREAYGPLCAFVCGWTFMLAVLSGGTAWLAVSFSIYLGQFVQLSPGGSKLTSLALVAVISAVNYAGMRESIWIQRTFTSLKIAGVLLLVGAAFLRPRTVMPGLPVAQSVITPAHFGVAMIACLMAYNGWTYISFVAGEVTQPHRNIPRALAASMLIVGALYVTANLAYMRVLSITEIAATGRVGAALANRTMGSIGATIVSLTVLWSVVGAINGCIMTAARVPFAQAQDGMFFARFGRIHPRFKTPAFAIWLQSLWIAVLVLSGSYETLFSYSIVAAWIFYTLSVSAVLVLRRKLPELPRPYKMWGYPYTMWLFILVSVWFIANALVTQFLPSIVALLIILTGVPFYFVFSKLKSRSAV